MPKLYCIYKPDEFPTCFLETTDKEVTEYYQPKHFKVGDTIFVYGRRFLLLNCDAFTRKYFSDVLKQPQGPKLEIKFPQETQAKRVNILKSINPTFYSEFIILQAIPEYLGLGTPEDSLASCFGLTPKPPRKDVICYLMNANKILRFGCVLDNVHPEDQIRQFILSYSLADHKIRINEPPIRNSGILGGKFLAAELVQKPCCNRDQPEYYTAKDLIIGATLIIHSHRFRIVSADLFVYRYMMEHPEMFSPEAIASVRAYCLLHGKLKAEVREALEMDCKQYLEQQASHQPTEPLSDMAQCLKDVNLFEGGQAPKLDGDDELFQDTARRNTVVPGECRYRVNEHNNPAIVFDDAGIPQDDGSQVTTNVYASAACDNPASNNKKRVNFEETVKCVHNKPTGNCMTCC